MNTHPPKFRNARRQARGFTLIELIVVIALIATVAAVVGGKIITNKERAEAKLADSQLKTLAAQVEQYQGDTGRYPESLQNLLTAPGDADGWLGPYVSKASELQDPWHNPIEYTVPGEDEKPFQLKSLGVDGKTGGEGVDADIVAP